MGVSGEDLRRRRIQKDVNNTSGYLWNGRMMNGSSTSTTESAESTPLSEVANTRIRSRPDHPTTVPANMGDKSEPPDSDVSDNDTPFKPQATLRFSTRRTKDEITLRERVDLSTFNGTSTLRTSREKHQSKKKSTSGKVATYHKKSTALPIHKKEKATPDLELSGPDAEFMNRVKEQLKLHMEKMRKEHKYQLVSALRRARIDIDKPQEGAQHYDKESPFKAMKPIELREYDLEEDTDISQYHTKLSIKHKEQGTSTFGDKELLYCPSIDVRSFKDCHPSLIKPNTRFNIVPKYHIYTTLANNVMVEDDDILRFVPYLGEESNEAEDAELFEENYALDLSKHARENGQQRELVEWISEDIERLLNLFETSINALSFYLIGDLETVHGVDAVSMEKSRQFFFAPDHDPEYHKTKSELAQRRRNLKPVKADELRRAEIVCRALRDVVGVRAWFVLKAITNEGKHRALANLGPCAEDRYRPLFSNDEDYEQSPEEQKMAVLSGGNPIPYQIDSYAKLHCPVCYMHQCPFHAATESISDSDDDKRPPPAPVHQEERLYDGDNANTYPSGPDVPCSDFCFIKDDENFLTDNKALLKPWSTAQKEILAQSLKILYFNQRAACMIASIINRPCAEIQQVVLERRRAVGAHYPRKQLEPQQALIRRKKRGILRLKKKTDILGYPRDCAVNTQEALARPPQKGCDHEGICSKENGCHCVADGVMCEKTCKCESCIRKWRGCRCARREIPCLPGQCECRKWNRECDADLCRTCGAAETLDPVNRYNLELAKSCCGNVEAQRGLAKRTFIGLSNIAAAGLGLFIGEDAKKDSFIGEYLGEIISEPEAERRGVLYDKRGVSFLFNLNKEQVVDAARAGNKLRFINHYHEPNCIARVVMTGVIHRIGLYALRDLYQGEELFFDYGYNEMTSNFVRAEPEFMFEPPSTVEKPKKNTKTTLGRPGKRKGLKGKKLGKKRLRAATKQSLTAGSLLPQKRPRGRPRKHFPVDVTSQPSSRTSSRIGRLDMATPSSYSDDEDDDDSDTSETSEGSVIMIRNPGQPDADSESEEEEEEEEDVHKKPKPRSRLAIPDSADEDEDYEDDDEEGSRSSKGAEMTPASDEDGPELLHGQRKRRRMYSPMSRSRR